jgi:hypothetical protein
VIFQQIHHQIDIGLNKVVEQNTSKSHQTLHLHKFLRLPLHQTTILIIFSFEGLLIFKHTSDLVFLVLNFNAFTGNICLSSFSFWSHTCCFQLVLTIDIYLLSLNVGEIQNFCDLETNKYSPKIKKKLVNDVGELGWF